MPKPGLILCIIFINAVSWAKPYLAIDVGATNVKVVVLKSRMEPFELKKASRAYENAMQRKLYKIPTKEILRADSPLVDLIDPDYISDALKFYGYKKEKEVSKIAFSLPLYLKNSRITYKRGGEWSKIPTYLSAKIEDKLGDQENERAVLANDAVAWALGTIEMFRVMHDKKVKYPAVGIAFGTGLAISLMHSRNHITILNINDLPSKYFGSEFWKRLGVDRNADVHSLVATPYFREHQIFAKGFSKEVKKKFRKRFANLIKDLHTITRFHLQTPAKEFYALGGLANLLEAEATLKGLEIRLSNGMAKIHVVGKKAASINTDLIPMMGIVDYTHRRGKVRVNLASSPNSTNIALKAANGKYLSAIDGGGREVKAFIDKGKVKSWEIFKLEHHPELNWMLSAHNGKLLSAVNRGGGDLSAYGQRPLDWEQWEMHNLGYGKVGFMSVDRLHYMSASDSVVSVESESLGKTETFRLEYR